MKAPGMLLRVGGLLLALVIGGVVIVAAFVDPNDYKPEITALVEEKTGRTLALHGDIELAFFPRPGVKIRRVELSNREGFGPAPMLTMAQAAIGIKLLPLLTKRLEIGAVLLTGPQIRLARKADGTTNWHDLTAKARRRNAASGTPAPPDAALLSGLTVLGISIEDGRVHWDDRSTGRTLTLSAVHLDTGKLVPGKPLDIGLSFEAQGGMLPKPAAITLTTTAQLAANLESFSLNDTDLKVVMESSIADQDEVNTHLRIPSLTFNLPDENLQLPALTLTQGDASLSASLDGDGMLSGIAGMTVNGTVDARAGDIDHLLKRNNLKVFLLPGMAGPVTVRSQYTLADRNITLINLAMQFSKGREDQWQVERKKVVIPINPDGTIDGSALVFVVVDSLKARARTGLEKGLENLKVVIKKGLNKNPLKALGVE